MCLRGPSSSGVSKLKLVQKDEVELPRSKVYVKGRGRKRAFQAKDLKTWTVVRIEREKQWIESKIMSSLLIVPVVKMTASG